MYEGHKIRNCIDCEFSDENEEVIAYCSEFGLFPIKIFAWTDVQ